MLVDEPAFPAPLPKDRLRIWTGSYFAPPADFGDVDLGLTRTELRFRGRLPINGEASVQVTGDFRASLYDEDGSGALFAKFTATATSSHTADTITGNIDQSWGGTPSSRATRPRR